MTFVDSGSWYAAFVGVATAFGFDQHFRQFGTIAVVP